ncbi:hypothetical protein ACBQ21_22875 [Pseudomonas putida]|uniref:hypothetical protein n=1 Tax=Pseudomonas putida TaxID=303 RepID=UPI0035241730
MALLAFIYGLTLLVVGFLVGRSDFAHDYGYLGLVLAIIGIVMSGRSQTWFGQSVSLGAIVSGVAAVAGYQASALLA